MSKKLTDKNKPKNEHINKDYTQDRSIRQRREEVKTFIPLNTPYKVVDENTKLKGA